jgi:4-alpha-glucanotransferase
MFMALRRANSGISWTKFDPKIQANPEDVRFHKFVQYEFLRQWNQLKSHCADRNILIMGDMPFYVEHDSADVWHLPRLFHLDRHGEALTVGGVPPDYFSRDGQLWGNPSYRWIASKKRNLHGGSSGFGQLFSWSTSFCGCNHAGRLGL